MTEAVIIDAVRTPGGKRNGQLKDWHPAALAAHVLKALEERNNLDPADVDDVIMGCVMQVGEQSLNIGRNAVLVDQFGRSILDYPELEVPQPDRRYYRMGTPGVWIDPAAPGVPEHDYSGYKNFGNKFELW